MAGTRNWVVHKFGGTSVGSAERYRGVARIIQGLGTESRRGIVVSAMKGATDGLIELVDLAIRRDEAYLARWEKLQEWHLETARALATGERLNDLEQVFIGQFRLIREVLRGVYLAKSASERIVELVSGYGEVWSAQLLNAYLLEQGLSARWLDAREVLIVEHSGGMSERNVVVDWARSAALLSAWLEKNPTDLLVITGFVASTEDGLATTLKRNGSDYSASIFGALLNSAEIVIWTDVDGVLSADPRLVPEAVVLPEMSYEEVTELAYFGAKVVHPATMQPAISRGIPIWIRNTFNPDFRGTKIHADAHSDWIVQGLSAIGEMALVNVEGTGMIGVPGVAERLFGALRSAGVSVVMISQASSEHSICFAIPQLQAETAKKVVEKAFYGEIAQGLIQKIEVTPDCSILAVVGDNMAHHPGVAARFFSALGKSGVNVRAIAQGSSERNISAVVAGTDATRALRAVHSSFYLSHQTLSVGVIGTGLIGSAFLRQLQAQAEFLRNERRIDIRIRALANSRRMLLDDRRIALDSWENRLAESRVEADLEKFVEHVRSDVYPHSVIIDATASAEIARRYPQWLRQGIHIVTPNKKANAASLAEYEALRRAAHESARHFLYSTNVGAGLPVLHTLRDLHLTGDRIISIEGVFSGTLSYIFNTFDGSRPFSEIVREARAKGYTEPDPRDDLSGMDVARKLVILAREIGLRIELEQVELQGLVPPSLREGDVSRYLERLTEQDQEMTELLGRMREKEEVLRYVGTIDADGRARVTLKGYPRAHPFARITGSDNIVAFRTARYDHQPLVIQGPGAGPEVTAAGVFADILRLVSYFGEAT